MAAGLKYIKDHIKAIANIQKITSSMKMVSATKFLKAEKKLINARVLGQSLVHFYDLNPITLDVDAIKIHLCPLTTDRGLCGSMPTLVCKYTRKVMSQGGEFRLICLGEKSRLNFSFDLKQTISLVINGIGHGNPTFVDGSSIAQYVLDDIDFIYGRIIFCHYINVMNFEIHELPVYSKPVMVAAKELDMYENEDENIHGYLEFSVAALFFYALTETYVVELASRMNAMSNASRNAGQLGKKLNQQFNRLRQASVTREIVDIISGAQVITAK